MSGAQRLRHRVLQQVPKPWEGEVAEDVAVFDDAVRLSLPLELSEQVTMVREALQLACELRGEEATSHLSTIGRRSPLSDWRLLIRGLVAWLDGNHAAALADWERLDLQRRPGRVAVALSNSLRTDLNSAAGHHGSVESISEQDSSVRDATESAPDAGPRGWREKLDDTLLYHARLVRRIRFDRAAIRVAEAGVSQPEESDDLLLGPSKITWLKRFVAEHRATEPDLVASLERVALARAYHQSYSDLFSEAANAFEGPRHDRANRLLRYHYYCQFASTYSERAAEFDRHLDSYLRSSLPANSDLPESLRAAIASQIHLMEAINALARSRWPLSLNWVSPQFDDRVVHKHYRAAIEAYPENRRAYQSYTRWIQSQLEDGNRTAAQREPQMKSLLSVMQAWSRALPEDIEPRLWLVDNFLENQQTEEARPHVEYLASVRHEDPRVRATPWKWQVLETMRLSRRKAWLEDAEAHLNEAAELWPAWLSRKWIPYLRAALALRAGDQTAYEARWNAILAESGRARDTLVDACMMLGAAQHLHVPADALKPLRTAVDRAVGRLRRMDREELLDAAPFFWDLRRTKLVYPAYRMHGSKIIKALMDQLAGEPTWITQNLDELRFQSAILLAAEHRTFVLNCQIRWPHWFRHSAVAKHPGICAARLMTVLSLSPWYSPGDFAAAADVLREAGPAQRDPFYRYWYGALVEQYDEWFASCQRAATRAWGPLDRFIGGDDDEDDEDDDSDF